jgi:hypothetical protein
VDYTFADGVEDEFGGSMEAELFENVAAMSFDGIRLTLREAARSLKYVEIQLNFRSITSSSSSI